jgi:hypothetical protein
MKLRPDLPLFLITALGIALRLANIGYAPLKDMDEAWSLAIAQMPAAQIIMQYTQLAAWW